MTYDCQTVTRIVFLCFVVLASVYFMIANKSSQRKIEHFEEKKTSPAAGPAPTPAAVTKGAKIPAKYDPDQLIEAKDTVTNIQLINDLFDANMKRQPSRKETEFYLDYISTRKLVVRELNEIIAGNTSVLQKTFNSTDTRGAQYNAKDPVLGTEDDVILVFNEILSRNPDYGELRYYSQKVKNDKEFSLDKLKQLLIASDEYKRLEKTQTNLAYSDTLGGITDRQLNLVISSIYEEEAKQPIDDDTLRFLKKRYNEFNLNDETLRKFIRNYLNFQKEFEKDIKKAAPTGVSQTSKEPLGTSLSKQKDGDSSNSSTGSSQGSDAKSNGSSASGPGGASSTSGSGGPAGAKGPGGLNPDNKPNQEIIKKLERLYETDDSDYLNSSKVINTLMQEEKCDGDLDKNALEKRLEAMDKQLLAKLVYDRNMDHMKNVCRRNQKYLNADQDMVLFPEFKWSVPQKFPPVCTPLEKNEYQPLIDQSSLIGTLLTDADKTKVGSILPKTPPNA